MLDRNEYARALWGWFIERAYQSGSWGVEPLDRDVREHLLSCGIDVERSSLPEVGSVEDRISTDAGWKRVPAITISDWSCNCGKYGDGSLSIFIPGQTQLSEVIYEVIQKVLEENS